MQNQADFKKNKYYWNKKMSSFTLINLTKMSAG